MKNLRKPKKPLKKIAKKPAKIVKKPIISKKKPAKLSKAKKPLKTKASAKKITKKVVAKKIKPIKKIQKKAKIVKKPIIVPRVVKPKATRIAKAPKIVKHQGYTDVQYEQYKQLIKDYNNKTNEQLKEALRANIQSKSGDKKTLLEKVADGEIKGGIPRCPKCGGGYLKYDFKTDIYSCKGYMDDTDWKFCNFRGLSSDVTRTPWVKPAGF